MEIKNIFGETIQVQDLDAEIIEANKNLGFARSAAEDKNQQQPRYIEKSGKRVTLVSYHRHNLNELLKLLLPLQYPDWLFVGVFPSCYIYCDMLKEENRDFKEILRLYYNPLRIEIETANMKAYTDILEIAKEELRRLQMRVNEPLVITETGQTTRLSSNTGPEVVVK